MTYTDTSDLTDAEIEAAAKECGYAATVDQIRRWVPRAVLALARANKRIAALEAKEANAKTMLQATAEAAATHLKRALAAEAEFDAYRKDVAEGVKWPDSWGTKTISYEWWHARFARFAAPEPEPDLLEECIQEVWQYAKGCEHMVPMRTKELRQAAASKGYVIEVRKAGHDA